MSIRPLAFACLLLFASIFPKAHHSFSASAQELPSAPRSFAEPAISPDRREVAFVSGGDIWSVPRSGGEARLLVSHPATESRPLFSPDGKRLAFISNRTGNGDIYLLDLSSGALTRLTFDDAAEQLNAWSYDGRWIYFSSTAQDIAGMNDVYRVPAEGGTPFPVSADRYANEYFAAPSPDGATLALTARGIVSGQWWRRGHSHIDESEIWLLRQGGAYEAVTNGGAKDVWPMWGADGKSLYYVEDRDGVQNIWVHGADGKARQVTKFTAGRVLWPTISYDGQTIVFERDFGIWHLDVKDGKAEPIAIALRGAPVLPTVEHLTLTSQFQELDLSPDGKKIAFVARGEVFAASAKDGGNAFRVTSSVGAEQAPVWSPDSRKIVYASDRDGQFDLFVFDFTTNAESRLTSDPRPDYAPRWSPDGMSVAFLRGVDELCVVDLETKKDRMAAKGRFSRPPLADDRPLAWSPDGKWIAFLSTEERSLKNAFVVPAAGGERRQVSFLSNVFGRTLSWSSDGGFLMFGSGQRTEDGQIVRVDLTSRAPKFREDQFRDLFKDEPTGRRAAPPTDAAKTDKPEPKKPVEVTFDGIRRRLALLPVGVNAGSQVLSPDGKTVLFTASVAGQTNLYTYSLDELSREPAVTRQVTSTPGGKSSPRWSPDGKEVFFLEQGRISTVNVETRQVRPVSVTVELDVDFAREKMQVFAEAWTALRDYFYDPAFHGRDWQAVRKIYEPRIAGAQTPDEMRRLLSLMVGELNASHLGVNGPGGPGGGQVGKLGLRFDRNDFEANGVLKVTEVIPLGPAAIEGGIKIGETVAAIDGNSIGRRTNLDALLAFKAGKRITATVAGANGTREVVLQPVSLAAEKNLVYRQWVESRREYVAKVSGGRFGYVHIPDMSAESLAQFYVDLDAENMARDGVVIDVRNNNGGFVNVYAIDVLSRRSYFTMTQRDFNAAPSRTVLGQRSLELPTVLVTNQHSLSDAEDFTEGYRTLKLGKVVGEPTSGWIIYTTNIGLIDGTGFRIPFIKITGSDGKVMELNPRPVDVPVKRPIGESFTGKDSQLDAAIRELGAARR